LIKHHVKARMKGLEREPGCDHDRRLKRRFGASSIAKPVHGIKTCGIAMNRA
jgi:hypothetical protein